MLVRLLAIVLGILLVLPANSAWSGQASSGFTVGLTIGNPQGRALRSRPAAKRLYTWRAAAISLQHAGYRRPMRLRTDQGVHWFLAERGGRRFRIAVSAETGAILRISKAI